MTKNVMYSMTTPIFSITMMTTRFPRMVQTIMKKIILIAFLPWFFQFIPGGAWAIFHILIVSLQAYIIMVLSVVYLSTTEPHH